jgi:hypothetical protein
MKLRVVTAGFDLRLHTKNQYTARVEGGKRLKNLANFGGSSGDLVTIERQGEYHGLTLKLLGDVSHLLTDFIIIKALKFLEEQEFIKLFQILRCQTEDQCIYIIQKSNKFLRNLLFRP